MNTHAYKITFLLLLGYWLSLPFIANAADIKVSVDRNPIAVNESFQITFTATETPDDDPDFSKLQEDFSILEQSQSENGTWSNRKKSSKVIQWIFSVTAKKTGKLTIPAIQFGNDSSTPLAVTITPADNKLKVDSNADLFMEVSASPETPYLQAQVLYTLKLYTRVEIARARLDEPQLPDAVIEKLGEDSNYNTQINGVDYSVTERKYAIFPQKSGALTIKPLQLIAEISSGSRSTFNGFFSQPLIQNKRVESKAVTLNVKAIPANIGSKRWLPAEQVSISQQWSGDFQQMAVGEPITRTLRLQATGISVGQLPSLSASNIPADLKVYPDQPALNEQKTVDGLVAVREEKQAIIPSKAGNYTLPDIEIPWFNTKTEQLEMAIIPATEISVAAAAAQTAPTPTPITQPSAPQIAPTVNTAKPEQLPPAPENPLWMWSTLFLAIGWLATLGYFLRPRKNHLSQQQPEDLTPVKLSEAIVALKKACADNNATAAKTALLAWGKLQFDEVSLGTIASHCEARLRDEIMVLNQVLYGQNPSEWQGKKLFQTFSENNARTKTTKLEQSALKPLYRL